VIRVVLPYHLRTLARIDDEVHLDIPSPVTARSILDAVETRHPVLQGTIRDRTTLQRRPFIRFYACKEDLSNDPADNPLPEAVIRGDEPFHIVGAMAGG